MADQLKVGDTVTHYKRNNYVILHIGTFTSSRLNTEFDLQKVVTYTIYEGFTNENNPIWTRPYSEFYDMVEYEGRIQPRFTRYK